MGSSKYTEEGVNWDEFLIDAEHDALDDAPRTIEITVTPTTTEDGEPASSLTMVSNGWNNIGLLQILNAAYQITLEDAIESGELVIDDGE